jgi:outer membrane protein assembly factor BamB
MFTKVSISMVLMFAVVANVQAGPQDWLAYARTMSRESIAVDGPNTIDNNTLAWNAYIDPQDPNYYVNFIRETGPIVYNGKVYAYAAGIPNNSKIIAYDADSGQAIWWTEIDEVAFAMMASWSTPCIDTKHNTVLIGSGQKVFALDANSGAKLWATQLNSSIINASVCVAIDIPHTRAFITDYAFDSNDLEGRFYCINLDAYEPDNPYQPGQIVWSQTMDLTSGNSPAYRDGVVYVASVGEDYDMHGTIRAFDATANSAVELWRFTNPDYEGFWGGVVVTKEGFLYAATYNFYEGWLEDNSTMFKVNCSNGNIVWTAAIQSTNCVPVVVGDKIYVSGGYTESKFKIEAYYDYGETVTKLWQTDTNLSIGGWDIQPVYANGKLYVGASSLGYLHPFYDELYILNVTVTPDNPNFVIAHYTDWWCGYSPAVTYDSVYAIGDDGLFKFHQQAFLADISKNNAVDINDLYEFADDWLYDGPVGVKRPDLDLDGYIDFIDFAFLANEWRQELSGE